MSGLFRWMQEVAHDHAVASVRWFKDGRLRGRMSNITLESARKAAETYGSKPGTTSEVYDIRQPKGPATAEDIEKMRRAMESMKKR